MEQQLGMPDPPRPRDMFRAKGNALRMLTTRGNAVGYLSGGFLFPNGREMPEWAKKKLYRDPGQIAVEHLVFFRDDLTDEAVASLCTGEPGQFPMLLEIEGRWLKTSTRSIDRAYAVADGPGAETALAWTIRGLVPTVLIRRVLLRSEDDKRDFLAQDMGNFDPLSKGLEVTVDPSAFRAGSLDIDALQKALWDVGEVEGPAVPTWQADALAGVGAMVAAIAERRPDFPVDRLVQFLIALEQGSTSSDWLMAIPERLLRLKGVKESDERSFEPAIRLFLEAVDALACIGPSKFVPSRLLEALASRSGTGAESETVALFRDVLDAMTELDAVPAGTPDLLMAVLDVCRAGQRLPQLPSDRGKSVSLERELGAAVLTGALLGRGRLPLASHPRGEGLRDRVDGAVSRRANALISSGDLLDPASPLRVKTEDRNGQRIERIDAGRRVLLERIAISRIPPSADVLGRMLREIDRTELAYACAAAGWAQLVTVAGPFSGVEQFVHRFHVASQPHSAVVANPLPNVSVNVDHDGLSALLNEATLEQRAHFDALVTQPDSSAERRAQRDEFAEQSESVALRESALAQRGEEIGRREKELVEREASQRAEANRLIAEGARIQKLRDDSEQRLGESESLLPERIDALARREQDLEPDQASIEEASRAALVRTTPPKQRSSKAKKGEAIAEDAPPSTASSKRRKTPKTP